LHADLAELILPSKDLKIFPPLQRNLKTIDVSGNKLESLPDAICEIPFLQKLTVDDN
jgi:Leucine-rich repeat (LRR) protein